MGRSVLLVDDDSSLSKLLQMQLIKSGYNVVVANTGETGLAMAEQTVPEVILMDVKMEGMGGLEACRRMREIDSLDSTPIIMLSGMTQIVDKRLGFEVGADDYLVKPVDIEELKLRIESHLKRMQRVSYKKREATFKGETSFAWSHAKPTGATRRNAAQNTSLSNKDVRVSVVLPTLNEADNLPDILPWIPDSIHEVILVDGLSTDGTIEVALSLRPDIKIVMQKKRGKGSALRAGFAAATGDIIVMLDADGSTNPAEIPAFVGALLGGADFAKGSRFLQGGGTSDMPFYRKLGNLLFVNLVRVLFGGSYSDLLYGYNAFWTHVLPLIQVDVPGFEIETLMNIRALRTGIKIAEVPSFETERMFGTAKLRAFPDGWRVLMTILHEYYEHYIKRQELVKRGVADADRLFVPLVGQLFREALHLWESRAQMSPEFYLTSLATIKENYLQLLDTEFRHPEDQLLQKHYIEQYAREVPWSFAEQYANAYRAQSKQSPAKATVTPKKRATGSAKKSPAKR